MPSDFAADPSAWGALQDRTTARLSTTAPLDTLWVPQRVELNAGALLFRYTQGIRPQPVPEGLLEKFLKLDSEADMLRFARQFGPLGIIEVDGRVGAAADRTGPLGPSEQLEALHWWRRYQVEFRELLLAANAVLDGSAPLTRDIVRRLQDIEIRVSAPYRYRPHPSLFLEQIGGGPFVSLFDEWNRYKPEERRAAVAGEVARRLGDHAQWCGLTPRLTLSKGEAQLVFQDFFARHGVPGISVLGALCLQALMAASVTGFAQCSGCGALYVPQGRRPAKGRRSFCVDRCGPREALKRAKADYRARERERRGGPRKGERKRRKVSPPRKQDREK